MLNRKTVSDKKLFYYYLLEKVKKISDQIDQNNERFVKKIVCRENRKNFSPQSVEDRKEHIKIFKRRNVSKIKIKG